MVLHTIIDLNEIMCDNCHDEYSFKRVNGVLLEGRKMQGSSSVHRIISTDLKDYLNESYTPGTRL